jgi:hypothetical protein
VIPRALHSRWQLGADAPVGDPEPIETAEPTPPAPRVRPIVLVAAVGNVGAAGSARPFLERAALAA